MDTAENKLKETPMEQPKDAPQKQDPASLREEIKKEMEAALAEYKKAFDAELTKKDAQIAELTEQNKGLQRTLIRSALMDPPKEEHIPTPEEIYRQQIDAASKKTLELMMMNIMG